jgi:hypothetical protein
VLLAKDKPIVFQDKSGGELAGMACQPTVTKDEKNAYYGGFVYPQRITMACK